MVVIAVCIVINSTLPIWLRLAKFFDDRKIPATSLDDDDDSDDHSKRDNNNSSHKRYPASSIISDGRSSTAVGAVLEARPRKTATVDHHKRRKHTERDIRFVIGKQAFGVDHGVDDNLEIVAVEGTEKSVLGRLSVDDVSMKEGVTEKGGGVGTNNVQVSPYERRSCFQVALEVSEWDSSLASLAGFYILAGLTDKIVSIVELGVIGHAIGTTEANAYIMVVFLFEITGVLVAGFQEGRSNRRVEANCRRGVMSNWIFLALGCKF